jgi:hypothetical protein
MQPKQWHLDIDLRHSLSKQNQPRDQKKSGSPGHGCKQQECDEEHGAKEPYLDAGNKPGSVECPNDASSFRIHGFSSFLPRGKRFSTKAL